MQLKLFILGMLFNLTISNHTLALTQSMGLAQKMNCIPSQLQITQQVEILFIPMANEALKKWHSLDHVLGTFGLLKSAILVKNEIVI